MGVSSTNNLGGARNCCRQIVNQGGGRNRRFDPMQHSNSFSSHQGKLRYQYLTGLTQSPSSGTEENNKLAFSPKAQPPSCQPSCHWCHVCLGAFLLFHSLDPASCCGFWCRIWITARSCYGNLLWFLFALRLLNINCNCICFLKQLASMILLPFVH